MSKHEIEVEGLPEGWEPVAFRIGTVGEHVIDCGEVILLDSITKFPCLIVKKKRPRRIVLEETEEKRFVTDGEWYQDSSGVVRKWFGQGSASIYKIWREVKETEEPKLCLSVEECEIILMTSVLPSGIYEKIILFLRNKNKTS